MRTLYIGRSPENDIVYNDSQVSGRHAEIVFGDDGQIIFTDYSTNGSYINGMPVHHASQSIMYGDDIMFPGNIHFDWNMVAGFQYQQQQPADNYGMWGNGNNSAGAGFTAGNDAGYGYVAPNNQALNNQTLSFSQTLSEGVASGLQNSMRLLAILLLCGLTWWIPYINIGVYIALTTLPAQWAKGEKVNPLSIFDSRYRRPMGNFLLSQLFVATAVILGMCFMVVPGIVIALAWSLTTLFIVEYDMNPLEATNASNTCTYGSKWTIFGVLFAFGAIATVVYALILGLAALIFSNMHGSSYWIAAVLIAIINLIVTTIILSIRIGIAGSIWSQLKSRVVSA